MQVVVVDNYFTGTKSNLKQWLGHPDFELIRHGKAGTCGMEPDLVFKYFSYANCEFTFLLPAANEWFSESVKDYALKLLEWLQGGCLCLLKLPSLLYLHLK